MKFCKIISYCICATVLLSFLTSCATQGEIQEPSTQAKSFYEYFDTASVIFSYAGDSPKDFSENCDAVEKILKEYHQLFDIYYEYSGVNNIKTINKNAGKSSVKVDDKLIDFFLYCKDIYSLS